MSDLPLMIYIDCYSFLKQRLDSTYSPNLTQNPRTSVSTTLRLVIAIVECS